MQGRVCRGDIILWSGCSNDRILTVGQEQPRTNWLARPRLNHWAPPLAWSRLQPYAEDKYIYYIEQTNATAKAVFEIGLLARAGLKKWVNTATSLSSSHLGFFPPFKPVIRACGISLGKDLRKRLIAGSRDWSLAVTCATYLRAPRAVVLPEALNSYLGFLELSLELESSLQRVLVHRA